MTTTNYTKQYEMTAGNNGKAPGNMRDLVVNFKRNFLTRNVEIVPGLEYNQY